MNDSVDITYRLTGQDYRRAVRLWYGRRRMIVVDLAVAVALIALYLSGVDLFETKLQAGFLIVGVAFVALMPISLIIRPTWLVMRDPRFKLEYRASFSPAGVRTEVQNNSSNLNWTFFTKARCDAYTCLLYYAPRQFMTVPLRVFSSDMDRARFCAMVKAKVIKFEQR